MRKKDEFYFNKIKQHCMESNIITITVGIQISKYNILFLCEFP